MNDENIPLRRCFGPGPLLSVLLAAVVAPAEVWGQDAEPRPSPQSVQSANPRTSLATGYAVDSGWPTRSPALDWGAVAGIAIGRDGEIWTFHRGEEPVRVFSTSGELLRSWGRGEFREPHQLRIDGGGNVWLVDSGLHVVRKYSSKCELLLTLGTKGVTGEDPAHFNRPTDVAVAPSGDVFVADGYGNNRIVHFDPSGKFVKSWGELGVAPGKFNLPHSIAVDSKGRLYVADRNNVRIQVFDQSGRFLDEWREFGGPLAYRRHGGRRTLRLRVVPHALAQAAHSRTDRRHPSQRSTGDGI